MARAILAICGLIIIVSACTERMICPAYQSAYIYDRNELRKKFSYFQEDSTPKVFTASKTKYLIAEPTPYRKKLRSIQTVPMKKVAVTVPDSISGVKKDSVIADDLNNAALSVMDTTMIVDVPKDTVNTKEDSTYVITKDKEVRVLKYNMPDSLEYDAVNNKYVAQRPKYYVKEVGYNTEQDNYMWYLRRSLVLPDVKLAKLATAKQNEQVRKEKKSQKGIRGFFNKLFSKKDKHDIDSAELEVPKEEPEFDFIDTTATVVPGQETDTRKSRRQKEQEEEVIEEEVEETPEQQPDRKRRRKEEDQPATVPAEEENKEEGGDGF